MKYLICALALTLAACSSSPTPTPTPGPSPVPVTCGPITSDIANAVSAAIASLDNCSNPAAMGQIILIALPSAVCSLLPVNTQVALKKLQVSKLKYKGIGADLVCPVAIPAIISLVNGASLLAAGNCTGNSDITAAATQACELIPF